MREISKKFIHNYLREKKIHFIIWTMSFTSCGFESWICTYDHN